VKSTVEPAPGWLSWAVAGSLIGLWLFLPPFSVGWGPFTLRNIELVRWVPLLLALYAVPQAFLRWHWLDLPILFFCACPLLAGVINDLGWSTSVWESLREFSYWWIPYALGRFLFDNEARREVLASCVVIGALLYLPPTIYEILYGPTFAKLATGKEFGRMMLGADRGATFRPTVFLSTGFVLTMFYAWAVQIAAHRGIRTFWDRDRLPTNLEHALSGKHYRFLQSILAGLFIVIVVLSRSLGSIVLMGVGVFVLALTRTRVAGVLLATLCLLPPIYIATRASGVVSAEPIHTMAKLVTSDERAGSLRYRLDAEELVFSTMKGHDWWGYGDWGLWINFIPSGLSGRVMDGFWLHAWTRTGMVSVVAFLAMVALPVMVVAVHSTRGGWEISRSIGFPCAVFLALAFVDSMFNYFGEAPVMVCVGVVTAWAVGLLRPENHAYHSQDVSNSTTSIKSNPYRIVFDRSKKNRGE
jgi:hypothetical protein